MAVGNDISTLRGRNDPRTEPRVLVVEDDAELRLATVLALTARGWKVLEAPTRSEAVALAKGGDPDVILLDLEPPDGDGLGVLMALKAEPEMAWIPVVVIAARTEVTPAGELLRAGAQDHVLKPCPVDELEARLAAARRIAIEHRRVGESEARHALATELAASVNSEVLAQVSHEVRAPMSGVIGMIDLLLQTELDDRQRDFAQMVQRSGEALMVIINDILDFSRIESGELRVDNVDFRIGPVLDDVVDLLALPAHDKGLELIAIIESSVPAVVRGDPGRTRQVLTNLIGNAVKFTPAGEVLVRISAQREVEHTVIRFDVTDTGDGIPADRLDLIFRPFVQADHSIAGRFGGTGLGLTISAQLAGLMGGTCGVSSQVGVGCNFWFTIADQADSGGVRHGVPLSDAGLVGIRVLIVDDSATLRSVWSEYLTELAMSVSTFATGEAALVALRAASVSDHPFSVAIIDQELPGMTGRELTDAIAADAGLRVRVIMTTDLSHQAAAWNGEPPAVCATLPKPVHQESLRASLRRASGFSVSGQPDDRPRHAGPPHDLRTRRILLAEDSSISRRVAVAMLSGAGYRVDTVAEGAAAVSASSSLRYDLILMDCQMPQLDGYQAAAEIRSGEGASRRTPIIAMTAGSRQEVQARCLSAGMNGVITKPVNTAGLRAVVERWMERPGARKLFDEGADTHPEAAIDRSVLDNIRSLGAAFGFDLLGQLVEQFTHDTEHQLVQLRQALADRDTSAVRRIARTIRTGAGQLGGRRLFSSCFRLETQEPDRQLDGYRSASNDIESDYESLRMLLLHMTNRQQ
jgi:two-component system, sensor histidine kinase and response regulator